ncbi:hypothetical protein HOLleu_17253 [Holothuria leucospilota]|uniref:Uncharacterized protein n=1 Tax=Holothuria leucospilota TaxID=206669 RepID=A0A9Q1H8C7_HOLLE|nr:hypothetical protein HOLleu_17253 [Holothuria leucospilota]
MGVPGRQVISGYGSPTDVISQVVDYMEPSIPSFPASFVRDTVHFLDKLRKLGPLDKDTIIATVDVVSLYLSIPHTDGLEALRTCPQTISDTSLEMGWMATARHKELMCIGRFNTLIGTY